MPERPIYPVLAKDDWSRAELGVRRQKFRPRKACLGSGRITETSVGALAVVTIMYGPAWLDLVYLETANDANKQ